MAAGPPAAPCAPCSKPWRPSRPAASVVKFPLPEVVMIPRHVRAGGIEGLAEAQLGARLSTPIAADVIDSLPDGPAEDSRLAQRFTIVVEATGVDGDRARGVVYGRDTYGTTAVIAVEAAHRLVTDPARPGVLAPAEGYDPAEFLDFLAPHGVRWTIDTADAGRASACLFIRTLAPRPWRGP